MNSSISRPSRSFRSPRSSRSFRVARSPRSSRSADSSFSANAPTFLSLYHFYHIAAPTGFTILPFSVLTLLPVISISLSNNLSIYLSIIQPRNKSTKQLIPLLSQFPFTILPFSAISLLSVLPICHFTIFHFICISVLYRYIYFTILTPIPFLPYFRAYWFYHFLVFGMLPLLPVRSTNQPTPLSICRSASQSINESIRAPPLLPFCTVLQPWRSYRFYHFTILARFPPLPI